MTVSLTPITPSLGAEIHDVDLANLSDDDFRLIHRAFLDRHVLVFRDQQLSRDAHKAFGRRFGALHLHPAKTNLGMPGDPEIFDIKISDRTKVANGETWHSDLSCEPVPPMASALYITEIPPSGGGDTLFANMQDAYDALSMPLQRFLEGLTAWHDGRQDLKDYGVELKPGETYPAAHHPVVVRHPETDRRLLFINESFTVRINELSRAESRTMLEMLYRHVERGTRFHCRVRWDTDTLVLWDNRAVHHHAVWDYFPERRRGERVTIKAPFAPQA